ncbi:phosphate signaling complex PhoU family protein [Mesoaciditoga lauensis]|uniref:phosphate signaling complex PhoU family protein n=1 Tax=Mesoaciditoga lauensis TaxID=1495039 RepID=UPI000691D89E|nr:PhoU domain-containing protein [Mesoaciditoga lauensis]
MIPKEMINSYKESVMKFGRFVEDMFDRSVYALVDRNADMAKEVIEDDKLADKMRDELNEKTIIMIGEYAPVGKQLVESVNGFILENALEMIGDKSVQIAVETLKLLKEPSLKPLVDLPKMASTAEKMMRISLDVYKDESNAYAIEELLKMEEYVDELNISIEDELKLYMMESPKNVSRALSLMFISKHIEDIADLCLKVIPKRPL